MQKDETLFLLRGFNVSLNCAYQTGQHTRPDSLGLCCEGSFLSVCDSSASEQSLIVFLKIYAHRVMEKTIL